MGSQNSSEQKIVQTVNHFTARMGDLEKEYFLELLSEHTLDLLHTFKKDVFDPSPYVSIANIKDTPTSDHITGGMWVPKDVSFNGDMVPQYEQIMYPNFETEVDKQQSYGITDTNPDFAHRPNVLMYPKPEHGEDPHIKWLISNLSLAHNRWVKVDNGLRLSLEGRKKWRTLDKSVYKRKVVVKIDTLNFELQMGSMGFKKHMWEYHDGYIFIKPEGVAYIQTMM